MYFTPLKAEHDVIPCTLISTSAGTFSTRIRYFCICKHRLSAAAGTDVPSAPSLVQAATATPNPARAPIHTASPDQGSTAVALHLPSPDATASDLATQVSDPGKDSKVPADAPSASINAISIRFMIDFIYLLREKVHLTRTLINHGLI